MRTAAQRRALSAGDTLVIALRRVESISRRCYCCRSDRAATATAAAAGAGGEEGRVSF